MDNKVKSIAFYLPQFYPTPENDLWWGPGHTEWTNAAAAKPLFKGHYQPKIPGQLSYYDLRLPGVREQQAELAKEAGIYGFCYWHYWFGNGKRLLSEVFSDVVDSGKPDFPFCLCWANHSWYNKFWMPNVPDRLLIEQTYPGTEDYEEHFMTMLPAFKDPRYIKVNDRLLFGFFQPWEFDVSSFMQVWNRLAEENGLKGFYFFDFCYGMSNYNKTDHRLFDLCVLDPLFDAFDGITAFNFRLSHYVSKKGRPSQIASYAHYCKKVMGLFKKYPLTVPCVVPHFDHSPRSGTRGHILYDDSPEQWGHLLNDVKKLIIDRPEDERLLFIKAWNEWGEGNYLEPDSKYGRQYIDETAKWLK